MKTEQKQVCSKCKKTIEKNPQSLADEKYSIPKSDNKFICINCNRKASNNRRIVVAVCVISVLFIGAFFFISNRSKTISSFDGTGSTNDTINIEMQDAPQFNIANTTAVAAKMRIKGQTVKDIESFKRQVCDNISQSTDAKASQIEIPSISVLFNFDSKVISTDNENLISLFAATYLKTDQKATILIEGYACNIGNILINEALSQYRATEINNFLLRLGVPADKLEVKWYGKSRNKEFSYSAISEYRRANVSIK